jgi:hypothetical protein
MPSCISCSIHSLPGSSLPNRWCFFQWAYTRDPLPDSRSPKLSTRHRSMSDILRRPAGSAFESMGRHRHRLCGPFPCVCISCSTCVSQMGTYLYRFLSFSPCSNSSECSASSLISGGSTFYSGGLLLSVEAIWVDTL